MIRKQGCQSICDARANLAIDAGGKLLVCFMVCIKQKRPERGVITDVLAEAVRFELTNGFPLPVFKTGAIDHSATLPNRIGSSASILTTSARAEFRQKKRLQIAQEIETFVRRPDMRHIERQQALVARRLHAFFNS